MDILKILGFIGVILLMYYLCFSWPMRVNREYKDKYGENGWSWIASVIIAIFTLATIVESGHDAKFICLLMATIISCILALIYCLKRAVRLGASRPEMIAIACSQLLFSFGIIFVVLVLIEAASDKKRRKTH